MSFWQGVGSWFKGLGNNIVKGFTDVTREVGKFLHGGEEKGAALWDDAMGNTDSSANSESSYTNASIGEGLNNAVTGNLDYARQDEQRELAEQFNAAEAQKSRDWQERMSNTTYQRTVQDLKDAGLSPAFLSNGGSSVGTGASASVNSSAPVGTHSAQILNTLVGMVGNLANSSLQLAHKESQQNEKLMFNAQQAQLNRNQRAAMFADSTHNVKNVPKGNSKQKGVNINVNLKK